MIESPELNVEGIMQRLLAKGVLKDSDPDNFYPADLIEHLAPEEMAFLASHLPADRLLPKRAREIKFPSLPPPPTLGELVSLAQRASLISDRLSVINPGRFYHLGSIDLLDPEGVRGLFSAIYRRRFGLVLPGPIDDLSRLQTGDPNLDNELGFDIGLPHFPRVSIFEIDFGFKGLPAVSLEFPSSHSPLCIVHFAVLKDAGPAIVGFNDVEGFDGHVVLTKWLFAKAA